MFRHRPPCLKERQSWRSPHSRPAELISWLIPFVERSRPFREQSDMKVVGVISMLPGEGKTRRGGKFWRNLPRLPEAESCLSTHSPLQWKIIPPALLPRRKVGPQRSPAKKKAALRRRAFGVSVGCECQFPSASAIPSRSGVNHPIGSMGIRGCFLSHAALFDLVVVDLPAGNSGRRCA